MPSEPETGSRSGSDPEPASASHSEKRTSASESILLSGPPVLPSEPIPAGTPAGERLDGRLHPLTLLFSARNAVRGILIPVLAVLFLGSKTMAGGFVSLFVGLSIVGALIRYLTFTYRIENGEIVTRQGIVERTERHIPLARVQDIRVEQGVLHRLLKMADVHVETAGGQGVEASFSVLAVREAERLRQRVFDWQGIAGARAAPDAPAAAGAPAPQIIRRLSLGEVVWIGLTSNHFASALAIFVAAWALLDDVLSPEAYQRITEALGHSVEGWFRHNATNWLVLLIGLGIVVGIGVLISVAGSIILFYDFTLSRRGEDLQRAYGLLTRRASSLPRRRIQVLKIEETVLRRLFRLATIRADTAGSVLGEAERGKEGRDVLLPVLSRKELAGILPVFFDDFPAVEPEWRRVSRRAALRRGTIRGGAVCLLFTLATLNFQRDWLGLWPLAFLPPIYAAIALSYRHLGFSLAGDYFQTRRGWLGRATHIVPVRNTQAVVVRQTPFDRRYGVGTLTVDTAGQAYTGGAPAIENVPFPEALAVARALAQRAAAVRYRWQ